MLACMFGTMSAQITNISSDKRQFDADSVIEEFDKLPFFGPFKDTYFTVGLPLNEKPNEYNSDVKFQISFRQRLTKSLVPELHPEGDVEHL